jgi:hypothetical protein
VPLLDQLDADFTSAGISIVHLKTIVNSPSGFLKAAICANGQLPILEGDLHASPSSRHHLLLNLRAIGAAQQVREIVELDLHKLNYKLTDLHVTCFHPAAPRPERRMTEIRQGI